MIVFSVLTCPKATHLGDIAAVLHIAPPPTAVFAGIHKQPAAAIPATHPYPRQIPGDQDLCRGSHDRPQHLIKRLGIAVPPAPQTRGPGGGGAAGPNPVGGTP